VQAGVFLTTIEEISSLVIRVNNNAPVYLRDVANVLSGADQPSRYAGIGTGPAAIIVGVAVVVTLMLMLFASWAWRMPLNQL
jgi:Cu/Ag efflux pump CusA